MAAIERAADQTVGFLSSTAGPVTSAPPTRRDFLHTLGGTAVLAACGDNRTDRFAGFARWKYGLDIPRILARGSSDTTAALGFARIEVSWAIPSGLMFPAADTEIDALAEAIADRGLECVTSHVEPLGTDDAANRAVFDFARRLGLRTIMLDAPPEAARQPQTAGRRVRYPDRRPG